MVLMNQWGLLGVYIVEDRPTVRPVLLESVRSKVTIRGFVAQVSATLVYRNDWSGPLEVECQFPVDEEAAVYKFEARLAGRTIIARCMEKKKAEKVYQDAVSSGRTAMIARENELSADILHLSLGNLPPESRAEVKVGLVMELSVRSDGGVSFVLPTILNPRYSPSDTFQHQGGYFQKAAADCTVFVSNVYSMEMEARVSGAHHIARIVSHTDPINVNFSEDTKSAEVTQDGGFYCNHDWSLVVYYTNPYKVHVLRETADCSGTGIMRHDLIMINIFPEMNAESYSNRNEIIFIIDRSGSMQGEKMQSARTTLLLFLKSLPLGCFFNVVSFGNQYSLLFPEGSREYNMATLDKACQLQANMAADMGGTEILQPLKAIYSKQPKPQYSRQILLISDGEVWNVDQVKELVARHADKTRVFSVGIGHGASTALIRGVARAGRGRSEMVVQQDMLQQKVMGLVSCMVQESVQEVMVTCKVDPPSSVTLVPKVPPVIFGGQHLVLYARVPPATKVQKVRVKGSAGGREAVIITVLGDDMTVIHDQEMSLHRLAARAQINQWQLDGNDEAAEDMLALSLASGVVSRRTALVGVDQESGPVMPPPPTNAMNTGIYAPGSSSTRSRSRTMRCGRTVQSAGASFTAQSGAGGASHHRVQATFGSSGLCRTPSAPPVQNQTSEFATFGGGALFGSGTPVQYKNSAPVNDAEESSEFACSGLLELVTLQAFDGSWVLKDVARLCGVDLQRLTVASTVESEAAWATAVVIALLEKRFSADRGQWNLLAIKARAFIVSCDEDVEAVITLARTFLDSL